MAGFNTFMESKKETQGFPSAASEPLDMGEGTRPRLTFTQFMEQKKQQPQVSPEVATEVAKAAPKVQAEAPQVQAGTMEEVAPYQEKQEIAKRSAAALGLSPYVTGGYQPVGQLDIARAPSEPLSEEAKLAGQEFIRTEALPTVGAIAAMALAPETGGMSLLTSMGLTAGVAGAGAATGEALEQTAKLTGVLEKGKEEGAPKDAWDILERSAMRGGEEVVWSLVPDMLMRGLPGATKKLLMAGGKPAKDAAGNTLDMGKANMTDMMKEYAYKHGMEEDKVLLSSDIADVPLLNAAEAVASNSYILTSKIEGIRETQEEVIKEAIKEQVGQYMDPALGYVQQSTDDALKRYVSANMDSLNEFGVAGLIRTGFNKAQEAQKSVARSMYKTIGDLMEVQKVEQVYKEVELPFMGPDGKPMTTMQNITEEVPAFPVDLMNVRESAMERAEKSLTRLDAETAEMLSLPDSTSYEKAANTLIEWRALSRQLGKATTEGAPVRKLYVDRAIKELEGSLNATLDAASAAGVVAPDGRSLKELKEAADGVWSEQIADFQNSYIKNILDKTDAKNGSADKLGRLFMQNTTAAENIMKVIEDGKGHLTGEALENLVQAENAIKGSIVQEAFMPFDLVSGKYMAPDVSMIHSKKDVMTRIFGQESYDELVKLASVVEEQAGANTSNYLGFAQRARESGMVMTALKGLTRADLGPLVRDGGATILFATGAGRLLTSPRMIRMASSLADPKVPEYTRVAILQNFMHHMENWQDALEASATENDKERAKGHEESIGEYKDMVKGIQ